MVGWHHRLAGREFEQTLGSGGGQGSPGVLQSVGGHESDTSYQLNNDISCLSPPHPTTHRLLQGLQVSLWAPFIEPDLYSRLSP